jgi:hypothetical protein
MVFAMKMKLNNKSYSNNVIVVANDNDAQQIVGTCLTPKVEISVLMRLGQQCSRFRQGNTSLMH